MKCKDFEVLGLFTHALNLLAGIGWGINTLKNKIE